MFTSGVAAYYDSFVVHIKVLRTQHTGVDCQADSWDIIAAVCQGGGETPAYGYDYAKVRTIGSALSSILLQWSGTSFQIKTNQASSQAVCIMEAQDGQDNLSWA